MNVLILQLDAPLMSFGTLAVDNWRPTAPFPTLSAVTGLLGAALGYKRQHTGELQRLQNRLRLAARIDRRGELLMDYQTADLGQPWMDGSERGVGWTSRHRVEARGKGESNRGTHIRRRQYWADAGVTLAVSLDPGREEPTVATVGAALREPVHPLYLGRKGCPPAKPLLWAEREARGPLAALAEVPRPVAGDAGSLPLQWDTDEGERFQEELVRDRRDWANQIHAGARTVRRGLLTVVPEVTGQ